MLPRSLAKLLRSERGIALPVSISVLMISGALAGAAAKSAVTADRQSSSDRNVKRAVAAADAGLNVATYRLNHFAKALTVGQPCVSLNAGQLTIQGAQADGWCAAQTETLGEGVTYSYRTSARQLVNVGGQSVWQRKIVATGTANGVQRRATASVAAPSGTPLFENAVFSDLDLVMRNSARINGPVRSNGNVVLQNSSSICGDVKVGPTRQMRGKTPSCGGSNVQATEPFVLSPVTLPAANDNARLSTGLDPMSGMSWSTTSRVLSGSGTVTLRGSNYVFCRIHLTNDAKIVIENDGTPVKIYLDAPERCGATSGNPSGMGSLLFEQKGTIDNQGNPDMAQLYVVGSKDPAYPTSILFQNNHSMGVKMTVYAPNSTFAIENQGTLIGAVAAKQVSLKNNSEISYHSSVSGIYVGDETALPVYKRQAWVECTPTPTGTAPDSGC